MPTSNRELGRFECSKTGSQMGDEMSERPEPTNIVLPMECLVDRTDKDDPMKTFVQKGWRYDFELDACRDEGTFASEVVECDRPLRSGEKANIVLVVWVPKTHVRFFKSEGRGKLKRAQYHVAQCTIRGAPEDWEQWRASHR